MLIFLKETGFDSKLKSFNKKVTSNKSKHVEIEKKPTELAKKVAQISERVSLFSGKMYFTGNSGYQKSLVFPTMFSSLTSDTNKKVTSKISTGVLPEKIKPFDTKFEWY